MLCFTHSLWPVVLSYSENALHYEHTAKFQALFIVSLILLISSDCVF